ncbi:MAG TPA: DUF4290 domain-containing protein, partial [Phnomibacter sp.]|nr:DUF4290 domain-containing protein [Phnomibacter sp.]
PNQKIKYSHLGKNLERVIDKAMQEPDPEKKSGFAHAIAHYMKLAYSTWHKELVHDDGIRQELNAITKGELEFTNTPYVRHRANAFREDDGYGSGKRNKFKQNRNRGRNGNNNNNNNNNNKNRNNNGKFGKKRY